MIANFKKKSKSYFFVVSIVSFFMVDNVVSFENVNNETVIMRIKYKNFSDDVQPRAMLSQHVLEKKDQMKRHSNNETFNFYSTDVEMDNDTSVQSDSTHLSFPYNMKIIKEVLDVLENEECAQDTIEIFIAMTHHEKWALEMFDSFPKFPVGILYGNYYQIGNFDECVGAKQPTQEYNDRPLIKGQYCLTDIHFRQKRSHNGNPTSTKYSSEKHNRNLFNNTVIHWGICLPSSCTTFDAQLFTKAVFSSAAEQIEVLSVVVDENKCVYEKVVPLTSSEIIYGAIVGCFLILIALATGLHIWYLRQRKRAVAYNVDSLRAQNSSLSKELIKCFSIVHTTGRFLHTKPNELNLECICGMKFLSMNLIIIGHSLLFIFGGPVDNKNFPEKENMEWKNGPFLNNPLLVDTFLLISGFLMCRLLLIELDKRKGKVNVLILYIARYIRLTPAYLVVIGFQTTLFYRIGSGPFWESRVGLEIERCKHSWWKNILYINNYVNDGNLCMFQSWYLATDYHLFILAPLIIYPLWRWRKIGEILLLMCTSVTVAVPFWITYKDNLDPTFLAYAPELDDISTNSYYLNAYIKTHMRGGSYCIGLFLGYLVHKIQSEGLKIPSYIIYLGWILSSSFAIISMYSIVIFFNPDHVANNLENAIYSSLHRIAWSLAIGWVTVACITDNAAIINKFLSWKPFIPLSRLTYCAYLTNGFLEVYNMGVLRQSTYLSRYELGCKLMGHFFITFLLAFILCICFESPIHGLEKILLSREKIREQKQNAPVRTLEEA